MAATDEDYDTALLEMEDMLGMMFSAHPNTWGAPAVRLDGFVAPLNGTVALWVALFLRFCSFTKGIFQRKWGSLLQDVFIIERGSPPITLPYTYRYIQCVANECLR